MKRSKGAPDTPRNLTSTTLNCLETLNTNAVGIDTTQSPLASSVDANPQRLWDTPDRYIDYKKQSTKTKAPHSVEAIARGALREDLEQFLERCWDSLYLDELYETGTNVLGIYALKELASDKGPFRSLRMSVALLRNHIHFEGILSNEKRLLESGIQVRRGRQKNVEIAYDKYLEETCSVPPPDNKAQERRKCKLRDQRRYANRWLTLINGVPCCKRKPAVPGLGPGLLLVCSDWLANTV
ncbi:hypothetical protein EYZ11_013421 [Aspergillus tanneri]|nr:hypothetical protein EYZ11_013421 [Aspergillus tanneri]